MKRIGLVTFHRPINFGAALQAVALYKAIENIGSECEILDYVNPAFENAYKVFSFSNVKSPKSFVWEILMVGSRIKQKKGFNRFIKNNVALTKKLNRKQLEEFSSCFDVYLTGSDQVWNYKCSYDDPTYFLDFVKGKPKCSYAASFGDVGAPVEYAEEYKRLLNDFSSISVREASGTKIIQELTGKCACHTLDPTLLLNKPQWEGVASHVNRLINDSYILMYFMAQTEEIKKQMFSVAKRLQEEYGYAIVVIGGSLHKEKDGIRYYNASSPYEFLALFRDASFVVTNSFHGTAFSVNFRKNFYSYVKPDLEVAGRVESLLSAISLKDRVFSFASDIKEITNVDYSESERLLEAEVEKSLSYLRKVVE